MPVTQTAGDTSTQIQVGVPGAQLAEGAPVLLGVGES